MRLRLFDCRTSRLPQLIGKCASDSFGIAQIVNSAQRRLMFCSEAGDEGWYGTWAEVAFNVSQSAPYITLPRQIARIQMAVACDYPVPVQNQFYEYLDFGNGRMPKATTSPYGLLGGYTRNNAVTWTDLSSTPQFIRIYPTNAGDIPSRVLIQGLDHNGKRVYNLEASDRVEGEFVQIATPFATSVNKFSRIDGIQKDPTVGEVDIYQVDPDTGAEVKLLTLEPSELVACYRRYYFDSLPPNCCYTGEADIVQVKAICKLEPLDVSADTDYLVIQNLEAIIEECQSVRFSSVDNPNAKAMAAERHKQAVKLLNGELTHYLGKDSPAVNFQPFGSARLECQKIGAMI